MGAPWWQSKEGREGCAWVDTLPMLPWFHHLLPGRSCVIVIVLQGRKCHSIAVQRHPHPVRCVSTCVAECWPSSSPCTPLRCALFHHDHSPLLVIYCHGNATDLGELVTQFLMVWCSASAVQCHAKGV